MPIDHYNPVLSGMMQAYELADRVRTRAMQEAQFKRLQKQDVIQQKQFDAQQKRQQEQDTLNEFKTRLALATNPEIAEVAPGQETRTIQMPIADSMRKYFGGAQAQPLDVPIDAPLEYQGKRYAVRGPEELMSRRLKEAEALNNVAAVKAGMEAAARLKASLVNVPPALRERLGMAPGEQAPYQALGGLASAARPAAERAPYRSTDDSGNVTQVNPDGSRVSLGKIGKSKTVAAGASGELTGAQKLTAARQEKARRQALQKEHDDLDRQEQEIHTKRRTLGGRLKDENLAKPQREQLQAQVDALKEEAAVLNRQKKEKLAQKEGAAPAAPPAAKPPQAAIDKMPVGQAVTFGNGQVWQKDASGNVSQLR